MRTTVIIPLYNKAPYVRRALDSVRAQTVDDFEVIVVDDGSTDGGGAIVGSYDDPRVRLIAQENAGPGAARNRGLAEAAGAYVAFLDADDEWLPSFLAKTLALLESQGPDVASATSGYLDDPGGRSTEPLWRRRRLADGVYRLGPETPPAFAVHLLAYLSPCTTVARAEAVRRRGGFLAAEKCAFGEDSYLWLKVLLNDRVALTLEPLVRIHREASALSGNLGGPRPVEPILTRLDGIERDCPAELRGLLARIVAVKAIKTACVLGYWGRWREARAILERFCPPWAQELPRYRTARLCASPLGSRLGVVARRLNRLPRPIGGRPGWS